MTKEPPLTCREPVGNVSFSLVKDLFPVQKLKNKSFYPLDLSFLSFSLEIKMVRKKQCITLGTIFGMKMIIVF